MCTTWRYSICILYVCHMHVGGGKLYFLALRLRTFKYRGQQPVRVSVSDFQPGANPVVWKLFLIDDQTLWQIFFQAGTMPDQKWGCNQARPETSLEDWLLKCWICKSKYCTRAYYFCFVLFAQSCTGINLYIFSCLHVYLCCRINKKKHVGKKGEIFSADL
jgi:hypothetical protein